MRRRKRFIPLEINNEKKSNLRFILASLRDKFLKGFSLLEVVIALAIFAVGVVGILSLFPVAFQSSKRASDLTEATVHAQRIMEEQKGMDYSSITDQSGVVIDSRFKYDLDVTESGLPTGLKKIELTIKWTERGKDFSEDFVTYVADTTP